MKNVFVYMDIYRCGKIARVAVSTFLQHYRDIDLYLYGVEKDFQWLNDFRHYSNLRFVDVSDDSVLLERWNIHGHFGTAHLWAKLIKSRPEKYLLHLDSDILFRGKTLDPIFEKIAEGYDLIGSSRNYKNNLNKRDDVRHLVDLVQTAIFAFNLEKINRDREFEELVQMCRGFYNPIGHPVIDFFDPVMFEIVSSGGRVFYLDIEQYGGTHRDGHRKNKYGNLNEYFDIGDLFLHFASVGSGLKYYYDPYSRFFTPKSYIEHGQERYWLFGKLFYGQDLAGIKTGKALPIFQSQSEIILQGVNLAEIQNSIDILKLEKSNRLTMGELFLGFFQLFAEIIKKIKKRL